MLLYCLNSSIYNYVCMLGNVGKKDSAFKGYLPQVLWSSPASEQNFFSFND